jgi:muramidase (phage lysozyme)
MSLIDPKIRAFLDLIGKSEGANYNILFGGKTFSDYSKHPNIVISASGYNSTAAGKYQFLYKTWRPIQLALNLPDFSPNSQDLACIQLLKQAGVYNHIINNDFPNAIQKACLQWASMPVVWSITDSKGKIHQAGKSYYGQGGHSLSTLTQWYNDFTTKKQ